MADRVPMGPQTMAVGLPWRPALAAATLSVLASACAPVEGEQSLPERGFGQFTEQVMPVLETRCANPSCHGNELHPLEIYAVHAHRADPDEVFLDAPLEAAEQWANYDRARGFLLGLEVPERAQLLLKPLAPDAGGRSHGGGVQFEDENERGYQAIRDWIRVELEP